MKTFKKTNERNVIIETFRLLACFWVLYYHDFFINGKTAFFGSGFLAVEFFFILSGFFLLKTLESDDRKPFFTSLINYIWKRLKGLLFPLIFSCLIAGILILISFAVGNFRVDMLAGFFYLWYILYMFVVFIVLFLIRKLIKSKKRFLIVVAIICVVSYITLFSVGYYKKLTFDPLKWVRAFGGISFGILLSQLPRNHNLLWNSIYLALFTAVGVTICLFEKTMVTSILLIILVYPGLIYFSNCINFKTQSSKFTGKLSLNLYVNMFLFSALNGFLNVSSFDLFLLNVTISICEIFLIDFLQSVNLLKKMSSNCKKRTFNV